MPEYSAEEAAARLQADSPIALIYLTAYADNEILARAKLTEPYGYLVKPFAKQALQASIETGLYKSDMERKQRRLYDAVVQAITELVKLHDPYLDGVQSCAAELAEAIAIELQLPKAEVRGIRLAAMPHCIGLVGVPSSLTCYGASLRGLERAIFQTHPQIAWQLLKNLDFPYPVAEMVYQHMEHLDGAGFPRGLSGAAILPGGRILAVACMAAKMLSARCHEPPASVDETIKALEQGRGTLFDANVVDACIRLIREKSDAVPA